jgi:hypothetical protein
VIRPYSEIVFTTFFQFLSIVKTFGDVGKNKKDEKKDAE